MKLKFSKQTIRLCILTIAFISWTLVVSTIDVKNIGPLNSTIGISTLNKYIHDIIGVHLDLYIITDWLSIIPLCCVMIFALIGLTQIIKRKSISNVDIDILFLGGYYALVFGVFIFFEHFVINYRPVLIEGVLEASYPSSTTLLIICAMSSAVMQIKRRIKSHKIKKCLCCTVMIFSLFTIAARAISGVHWFSDIVGGMLLGTALVELYKILDNLFCPNNKEKPD